jgi:hypothetical protein
MYLNNKDQYVLYISLFSSSYDIGTEKTDTAIYNMYNSLYRCIYNIKTQENSYPGGHTLSFMTRINLHGFFRFNLFVDVIIPKKLIVFDLFVYLFLI